MKTPAAPIESYRASFEGPKPTDPSALLIRIPGAIEVEVYRKSGTHKWSAREKTTRQAYPLQPMSLRDICRTVAAMFEQQRTPWSYHRLGKPATPPADHQQQLANV